MDEDKKSKSIRALSGKLYDPKSKTVLRQRSTLVKKNNPNNNSADSAEFGYFAKEQTVKKTRTKTNNFLIITRNFFFGALILFLISVVYAGLTFYRQTNLVSPENIELSLLIDPFIDSGEMVDLLATVYNKNTTVLEDAYLVIDLPNSSVGTGQVAGEQRILLGAIFPGQQIDQVVPITAFGQQGSNWEVTARLEYKIRGSSATFEKESKSSFTIRTTPVDIVIDSVDEVVNGQNTLVNITVLSRSPDPLNNLVLMVDYPTGFRFENSTPEPSEQNRIWRIGTLNPNQEYSISLNGVFEGTSREIRNVKFTVASASPDSQQLILNSTTKRYNLVLPFIVADIYLNNSTRSIVSFNQGAKVTGRIYWKNTFDDKIQDVTVTLTVPEEIEIENIQTDGIIRLRDRTITWDQNSTEEFDLVNPGDDGWLNFSFQLSEPNDSNINPEIIMTTSTRGLDSGGKVRETLATDTIAIRQTTEARFIVQSLYSTGPFTNQGPYPPKVETPTTMTVKVSVINNGNEINDGLVEVPLSPYAKWLGVQSASIGQVSYDQFSKNVKWNLGTISPNAGQETFLYFQVEIDPPFSFLGNPIPLTNQSKFSGVDSFTRARLNRTAPGVNSSASDAPGRNSGAVVN